MTIKEISVFPPEVFHFPKNSRYLKVLQRLFCGWYARVKSGNKINAVVQQINC